MERVAELLDRGIQIAARVQDEARTCGALYSCAALTPSVADAKRKLSAFTAALSADSAQNDISALRDDVVALASNFGMPY